MCTFYGIVTQLDIESKLYCVNYEDNELEEYSETEITTLVVKQKDIQEDYPFVSPAKKSKRKSIVTYVKK